MYNKDQLDHMKYLRSIPLEDKCWCGWYLHGECWNGCPDDVTCADKMKLKCEDCGNTPYRPGMKLVHIINCPRNPRNSEQE